jgi:hypothetical protein
VETRRPREHVQLERQLGSVGGLERIPDWQEISSRDPSPGKTSKLSWQIRSSPAEYHWNVDSACDAYVEKSATQQSLNVEDIAALGIGDPIPFYSRPAQCRNRFGTSEHECGVVIESE